jgi:hypothetical protein
MAAPAAANPAPAAHPVALAALWFGLFGAPAVWGVQLMLNCALVAHSCYPGVVPRSTPLFGGLGTAVLVASVVALAIAAAAGLTAWRSWRATRYRHVDAEDGRTRFMARAGMPVSGLFLLGVIMNAIPLFILPPCG